MDPSRSSEHARGRRSGRFALEARVPRGAEVATGFVPAGTLPANFHRDVTARVLAHGRARPSVPPRMLPRKPAVRVDDPPEPATRVYDGGALAPAPPAGHAAFDEDDGDDPTIFAKSRAPERPEVRRARPSVRAIPATRSVAPPLPSRPAPPLPRAAPSVRASEARLAPSLRAAAATPHAPPTDDVTPHRKSDLDSFFDDADESEQRTIARDPAGARLREPSQALDLVDLVDDEDEALATRVAEVDGALLRASAPAPAARPYDAGSRPPLRVPTPFPSAARGLDAPPPSPRVPTPAPPSVRAPATQREAVREVPEAPETLPLAAAYAPAPLPPAPPPPTPRFGSATPSVGDHTLALAAPLYPSPPPPPPAGYYPPTVQAAPPVFPPLGGAPHAPHGSYVGPLPLQQMHVQVPRPVPGYVPGGLQAQVGMHAPQPSMHPLPLVSPSRVPPVERGQKRVERAGWFVIGAVAGVLVALVTVVTVLTQPETPAPQAAAPAKPRAAAAAQVAPVAPAAPPPAVAPAPPPAAAAPMPTVPSIAATALPRAAAAPAPARAEAPVRKAASRPAARPPADDDDEPTPKAPVNGPKPLPGSGSVSSGPSESNDVFSQALGN